MNPQNHIGPVRRITGNILCVLAVGFTVYLIMMMVYRIHVVVLKDTYREVFRYELILCLAGVLIALDIRFGCLVSIRWKPVLILGWLVRTASVFLTVVTLFLAGDVIAGGMIPSRGESDLAIVLGMALENGQPTKDLLLRLQTAEKQTIQVPGTVLILTGGNRDSEGRTEAEIMREILLKDGIAEASMLIEDQSDSTEANFKNVAKITDPTLPITLITSDYHMGRAVAIAKEAGFTNIHRKPAPSDALSFGANVMWEIIMKIDRFLP